MITMVELCGYVDACVERRQAWSVRCSAAATQSPAAVSARSPCLVSQELVTPPEGTAGVIAGHILHGKAWSRGVTGQRTPPTQDMVVEALLYATVGEGLEGMVGSLQIWVSSPPA